MRYCKLCKTSKEELEFYPSEKTARCKECDKARKRKERITRDHHLINRRRNLKREYGLTLEDYDKMLKVQNGKCAICNGENPIYKGNLCVDHCHTTGKIRGLLCHSCNLTLGYMKDSKDRLKNAIKYLENYG
jgi:hypothetical protein